MAEQAAPDVHEQLARLQAEGRFDSAAELVRTHAWPEAQRPVAEALLRALEQQAFEARRDFCDQLRGFMPIDFDDNKLVNVVDYIRTVGYIDIEVDWAALKPLGVTEDTRITAKREHIRLDAGLDLVLSLTTEKGRAKLGWRIRDGRVVIDGSPPISADAKVREAYRVLLDTGAYGRIAGIAGKETAGFRARQRIAESPEAVALFKQLLDEAAIGGQAHALIGLAKLNAEAGHKAAQRFTEDRRALPTMVGCSFSQCSFSEIARQVLDGHLKWE